MKEFIFRGTLELQGVAFFVEAESEADAIEEAKAGNFQSYDADAASIVEWQIDPDTGEVNE